jgi:hypothetical protein
MAPTDAENTPFFCHICYLQLYFFPISAFQNGSRSELA